MCGDEKKKKGRERQNGNIVLQNFLLVYQVSHIMENNQVLIIMSTSTVGVISALKGPPKNRPKQ